MQNATLLDYGLILAYAAIVVDMSLQIRHVWARKSSTDISVLGTLIRALACVIFLTKYVAIRDAYLIVGQAVFMVLLIIYLFLIAHYRLKTHGSLFLKAKS